MSRGAPSGTARQQQRGRWSRSPSCSGHLPGVGLGTGAALRAERGCAVGCAWDRRTGFPSTDWKYNLHLYHSCICEFSARSRLSVSPQGTVMTQGGDRASQCPQPPWEGLPAPTVAPPSPCQAVPARAHAFPCAVIREQTGLCTRAMVLAAPSRTSQWGRKCLGTGWFGLNQALQAGEPG